MMKMEAQGKPRVDDYPKLSRPFSSMKSEYDVVVVGSGYGAGVAASRMARAGKSVAILEVGWERRAGSYPRTLSKCLKDMHVTGTSANNTGLLRLFPSENVTQLYQLILGDGQHVFLAHGLGGCSLVNAGVFLQADSRILQRGPWPLEIKESPSLLDQYYSRASTMLQPSEYPKSVPKSIHLREQSKWLKEDNLFKKTPLTTFFRTERNSVGVHMQANTGTGEECPGLNDGSKNTVATSYLTDAWFWGSEVFCGCQVQFIAEDPNGKGYTIYFALHGHGREEFKNEFKQLLFWVKAKEFCFLGAGAYGTTEILLRSKKQGMEISPMIGQNMSGNGDMIIFGYNGRTDVNGIAGTKSNLTKSGPAITSFIDKRQTENPLSGYVIEDGCIPEPFSPIIQIMLMLQTITKRSPFALSKVPRQLRRIIAALKSLVFGPYTTAGAIQRTATYLVMSHDSNEISMTIKGDRIVLRGPGEGRSEHLATITTMFARFFEFSGAKMGHSYFYGRNQEAVTVHLLGGANMSRNGTGAEGVTNHLGEVYAGNGTQTYPGLVCCDASIIPTSLGINPLATVSALAERSLALLAKKYQFTVDLETKNGSLDFDSVPKSSHNRHSSTKSKNDSNDSIGWQFTEVLRGQIDILSKHTTRGKRLSSPLTAYLTIEICNSKKITQYRGNCTGTVSCFGLSQAPLLVSNGKLDFFVSQPDCADGKTISYYFDLESVEGETFHFHGYKTIDSKIAWSILKTWEATTRVSTIITRMDGSPAATGTILITMRNFFRQMKSFRGLSDFRIALLWPLLLFFIMFAHQLSLFFFRPYAPIRHPKISTVIKSESRQSTVCTITAKDKVQVKLEIFEPSHDAIGNKPPILCLPGVTGLSAEHHLFALPFLRCNAVDYFTSRGHRCYALTPRWGCEEVVASDSTVFDCRLDVAAALKYVYGKDRQKTYIIAHCQGSVALCMGLLDGTIPREQILGITANSVFMNQVFAYWNSIKGQTTSLIKLYELLAGNFFPVASSNSDHVFQRVLDFILRFYPVGHRRDLCNSTSCHRTSFGFGLLWNHDNLNQETHDNIHTFFSGTHTKLLRHVVGMGSRGVCMDNQLHHLMTPDNLERLRGIPILFMSGTDNEVFTPETTLRDYELLRRRFGEELYRRFSPEGYGHLDPIVGKNAAVDVYWRLFNHLQWCSRRAETKS